MPGLVRKILIVAAVDGLVLQPLTHRGQRPAPAVKIAYKDHAIKPLSEENAEKEEDSVGFEAYGIIGR